MKKTVAFLLAATAMTPVAADTLTRVVTVPLGGEITGIYQAGDDLFFNVQHPDRDMGGVYAKATVGVVANANMDAEELAPAVTDGEKRMVRTTLGTYQILMQEGVDGAGIISSIAGEELLISNDPDFNGFIPTANGNGLLYTNWENRPGGMSRAVLTRSQGGQYAVESVAMVDFSEVGGTWVNCFGTVSPWNTPLTSEELYFDNTANWNNPEYKYIDDNKVLANYLGGTYPNPYNYGYIVEITDPKGASKPVKQMAIGRSSHENAVVMPDEKTVYTTSDGTGQPFFKFIADTAGDLTAGTLFAAKITQNGEAGADPATTSLGMEWIELGHSSNADIATWIADYDGITMDDHVAGENNYITDAEIEAWAKGEAADDRVAFLESIKAAKAKGATNEFRKMEGVNINLQGAKDGSVPFMYVAMSSIDKTMSDGEGDIDLAENKCGVVYEMALDANYDVSEMVPVVAGHGYNGDNKPNACPIDSISNPDNLIVLEDGRVLIGEDTSKHENNALWVWTKG